MLHFHFPTSSWTSRPAVVECHHSCGRSVLADPPSPLPPNTPLPLPPSLERPRWSSGLEIGKSGFDPRFPCGVFSQSGQASHFTVVLQWGVLTVGCPHSGVSSQWGVLTVVLWGVLTVRSGQPPHSGCPVRRRVL